MRITSADLAYIRPANDSRRAVAPAAVPTDARALQSVDPFDAADADFDFEAASRAASARLLRDQQQMVLAEMADARSQGSVSLQTAVAAYHEFDE